MADYMTWVENGRYNRARAEDRAAARRRQEADREVRSEKDRLRRMEKEGARSAARDEQLMRERIQAETDRLLDGIDEVSDEMRSALRRHVDETQHQMDGIRRSINDVRGQADRLDGKIDDLANSVSARFQALADATTRERSRAQLYSNQFNELLGQINELHPDKLTPGVVEQELAPVTNFLAMDMTNGDYQAAIGVAQTKTPEAVALRTRLEILNAEFRDLQAEATQLIEELRQRIQQLQDTGRNSRSITVGANSYEYDGDIVYWTNDLFTVVEQNFNGTCQRFELAETEMDLASMRIAINQLNQIALQLTECEELAQHEFQLFGMVQNLASAIYEVLTEDEAWTLSRSGFAEDDARRAFQMAYVDGDGNTASFVVIPNREVSSQGRLGEIQFMVDVCDGIKTRNRERCAILRNGILSRLQSHGIEIGAHNHNPRYAISSDQVSFINEATSQGDRIKENRLAIVREQLQLTA